MANNKKQIKRRPCVICELRCTTIEEHHVWMQAAGGEAGPTVPLCANCHSAAHKQALNLISTRAPRQMHFPPGHQERARPIVRAICAALLQIRENRDAAQPVKVTFEAPAAFLTMLHSLKADAGHTNLSVFIMSVLRDYARTRI